MGRPWKQDKSLVGKTRDCECGCGEQILILSRYHIRRFKRGHSAHGVFNGMWKGGRVKNTMGYILRLRPDHPFTNNDGYVYEHRLVWEEHHNASLLPKTIVHHKNGNKQDNRPENLEAIINNGKHMSRHVQDMDKRLCQFCNRKTGSIRNGRPIWYGSKGKWICNACYCKSRRTNRIHPMM